MMRVDVTEARQNLADALNRVAYGDDRVVISRRGKDVAVLVSVDDLALLEALEDGMDVEAARKVLKKPRSVSWKKVKADLGL